MKSMANSNEHPLVQMNKAQKVCIFFMFMKYNFVKCNLTKIALSAITVNI